ncbi:tetratricopeptide repeat protein [Hyphomonas sp.]|uniref:tetratricopeptide repeat protein n=1 Tax=Hyphomonas sp. TaxID=87 RepID=UPI003242CE7B
MFSSRSITAGLLALGFAADPAFAAPDLYRNGPTPAETCANGVATPGAASPALKRVCEEAVSEQALSRKDRAATLANSGIVSLRLGEYEPALDRLTQAAELGPMRGDISISLAATLIRLGRADEAIEALSDIEAVSPENRHIAYYNRALAYWALEDAEAAYRDFYASAALKPGFGPAEEALGQFQVASVE